MSFTSPNNDDINASRNNKYPLLFTGKKLSFYAVLMLYAQVSLTPPSPTCNGSSVLYRSQQLDLRDISACRPHYI
ncbi:hypothetical protein E2C01_025447 [Portunus trituberculatus]|uniref:Uncharacterized protein n=1 Tax=Portunus trituberculatus TaxID=210409 RepID=A0A5B7EDD6_PORTR|nr:hypothetical protein [Portunus trituberculatus]